MHGSWKRWLRFSLGSLGWVLLGGVLLYRLYPQVAAAAGVGALGAPMPAVDLPTLDGGRITGEDLRGKVVLVNFWATWCPPCRWEMPAFQRVYEEKQDQGFVLLGISTDRTGRDGVREYLRERGITYPVAMATRQVVGDFGGARALPTSILIGRDGTIRQRVQGYFTEPALRLAVNRLLAEGAAEGEE